MIASSSHELKTKSCKSWLPPSSASGTQQIQSTCNSQITAPNIDQLTDDDFRDEQDGAQGKDNGVQNTHHVAKSWTCPICHYCAGNVKFLLQKKAAHIKAWRPDKRSDLSSRKSKILVDWTPDCAWKCPHCNLGVPAGANTKAATDAKTDMADTSTPITDQEAFKSSFSREHMLQNVRKASFAKSSAGIASRLLAIKQKKQGDHDVVFLELRLLVRVPAALSVISFAKSAKPSLSPLMKSPSQSVMSGAAEVHQGLS